MPAWDSPLPSFAYAGKFRSSVPAPTVMIHGAVFTSEDGDGPLLPAEHVTTMPRRVAASAPTAMGVARERVRAAAERQREHVDAVVDGLLHAREDVGAEAALPPAHLVPRQREGTGPMPASPKLGLSGPGAGVKHPDDDVGASGVALVRGWGGVGREVEEERGARGVERVQDVLVDRRDGGVAPELRDVGREEAGREGGRRGRGV
ncbi:hypothetical protein ACQ4PT_049139 [Festuca glaucescens]